MKLDIINTVDGLEQLRGEWDALQSLDPPPHPFASWAWARNWARHMDPGGNLRIVCLREDDQLVGVVPLVLRRVRRCGIGLYGRLSLALGSAADYREPVMHPDQAWPVLAALFEWLEEEDDTWSVLTLDAIPDHSACRDLIPTVARFQGLHVSGAVGEVSPYVKLPPTVDEFYRGMTKSTRRTTQNRWRKFCREVDDPTIRQIQGAGITPGDMESLFDLHRRSWEFRGQPGMLGDSRVRAFHQDLASASMPGAEPLLLVLEADSRRVAANYGFLCSGVFCCYMGGFDPEYAPYSAGALMETQTIEHGIESRWTEIDLMKGAERYKFHYTRRCRQALHYTITKSANTLRAISALGALRNRVP